MQNAFPAHQSPAAVPAWCRSSTLAGALLATAEDWVRHPCGDRFENGYCESEMNASELRRMVSGSASEDEMVGTIHALVAKRSEYDPEGQLVSALQNALAAAGKTKSPALESPRSWARARLRR